MKGGVDELTPDSASGGKDSKQIRMTKKRNKKSNHRLRRLTQIIFITKGTKNTKTRRGLLGFGVLRQGFSPPKGCERPLPCPPNPE
jgi:hypothetical protein